MPVGYCVHIALMKVIFTLDREIMNIHSAETKCEIARYVGALSKMMVKSFSVSSEFVQRI